MQGNGGALEHVLPGMAGRSGWQSATNLRGVHVLARCRGGCRATSHSLLVSANLTAAGIGAGRPGIGRFDGVRADERAPPGISCSLMSTSDTVAGNERASIADAFRRRATQAAPIAILFALTI